MEITNKSIKTGEEQESQTIEWKWTWQEDYLKWLCGYANTDGGVLNIGVNDDGYVVGIEESKKMLEALPIKSMINWGFLLVFRFILFMVLRIYVMERMFRKV